MTDENKLENLSFESIDFSTNSQEELKKDASKNKFVYLLAIVLIVLFSSTGVVAYYLFFNIQSNPAPSIIERIEKPEVRNFDFSKLSERSDYQISLYLSSPTKDPIYIGEGVLISPEAILSSSISIKDYESKNLLVKKGNDFYKISHMEGHSPSGKGVWVLFLKSKLDGEVKFTFNEFKVGESYFLRSSRTENAKNYNGSYTTEIFIPLTIIGKTMDGEFLTDIEQEEGLGLIVYNKAGELVGIVSDLDSKNRLMVLGGQYLEDKISSSLRTVFKSNKDIIGIDFEFSDLSSSKKEGKPVGLVVRDVKKGSKASLNGIEVGDTVLTINNQIFTSSVELDNFFSNLNSKEEIKFEIVRENKKMGVTLSLE